MTLADIRHVLVVGAGQMGAQIAMQTALHGYRVTLNDLSMDVLERAMRLNRGHLERRVAKGQLTSADAAAAIGRVAPGARPEPGGRDHRLRDRGHRRTVGANPPEPTSD